MFTLIEIDGFKTFDHFSIELTPFTAIVGPNATGKSNLFDAIALLSGLAKSDVRSALAELRGEPEELFRQTSRGLSPEITISAEVLLPPHGVDQFGAHYELESQRLRYTVRINIRYASSGAISGIYVSHEECVRIPKLKEKCTFLRGLKEISYGSRRTPFLEIEKDSRGQSFLIRQDGKNKHGNPSKLSASEATRTALSTIQTAEFPHLYALRDFLSFPRFLEISPIEARSENDRFEDKDLLPNASNLAAVIARIRDETATPEQPDGVLIDISTDISHLIPSVKRLYSVTSLDEKKYSYEIEMADGKRFSSRVISDGTLRLLSIITVLNDPRRRGVLCFEEPENGIHEGRIDALVQLIRDATKDFTDEYFQVVVNTHSPAVMRSLNEKEIVAADIVTYEVDGIFERRTRMRRTPQRSEDLADPGRHLTWFEVEKLLHKHVDAA